MTSMTNAELREELAEACKIRDMLTEAEAYADRQGAPLEVLNWIGAELLKAEADVTYAKNECDFRAGWEARPRAWL